MVISMMRRYIVVMHYNQQYTTSCLSVEELIFLLNEVENGILLIAYSEFNGHCLSLSLPDIATFRCTLFFLGCSHGEEVEVVV